MLRTPTLTLTVFLNLPLTLMLPHQLGEHRCLLAPYFDRCLLAPYFDGSDAWSAAMVRTTSSNKRRRAVGFLDSRGRARVRERVGVGVRVRARARSSGRVRIRIRVRVRVRVMIRVVAAMGLMLPWKTEES